MGTIFWLALVLCICGALLFWSMSQTTYESHSKVTTILKKLGLIDVSEKGRLLLSLFHSRYRHAENQAYLLLFLSLFLTAVVGWFGVRSVGGIPIDSLGAILVRISTLLIAFFGIGFLFRLYRLQLEHANFYLAQYDGVLVWLSMGEQPGELHEWMARLLPPFRMPTQTLPTEQASRMFETIKSATSAKG